MHEINNIITIARNAIDIEIQSVLQLRKCVDESFAGAVNLILHSCGRVIISGIGKSANIAAKIVATLNSTGTPSIFMHAADAIHGDLGIIQPDDVVICLSKSGNTPEIKVLVPLIKKFGNPIIALTSNKESYLAQQSNHVIFAKIEQEACPNKLAPTTSTTAQLIMGDALAVSLLECRGFSSDDFAKYHPGGALGKQLYLQVSDLYVSNKKPSVKADNNIKDVIIEISSKCLGITAVVDDSGTLLGVITDGDLRRMLENNENVSSLKAKDIMTLSPKHVSSDTLALSAFNIMKKNNITQLPVVDNEKYMGVVHIHDMLREGFV